MKLYLFYFSKSTTFWPQIFALNENCHILTKSFFKFRNGILDITGRTLSYWYISIQNKLVI